MHVRMMVIADYAEVEADSQQVTLSGIVDRIRAAEFPLVYPRLCLALMLEGDDSERALTNRLRIRLCDGEGVAIAEAEGNFALSAGSPGLPPQKGLVCEFYQLRLPSPGDYVFSIDINDGQLKASKSLQALKSDA